MSPFAQTMTIICAVDAGAAAGALFTFSTFTMEGLKRLAPTQGAAAMQAIKRRRRRRCSCSRCSARAPPASC